VRLEGLGQLKNFNNLIGNRTRDFSACGVVSQTTTLLQKKAKLIFSNRSLQFNVVAFEILGI
jgi:hypothetical protein